MSVPTWERKESPIQFIDKARELEEYTLRICARFPKRFMFIITHELIERAQAVYDNAIRANEVYPSTKYDLELKIGYLSQAIAEAEALSSQLTIAVSLVTHLESGKQSRPMTQKTWSKWGELIVDELALLRAVKKSWNERYKEKK